MVTISVYSSAWRESRRRKNRQFLSVQSIIGATEKRRDSAGRVVAGLEAISLSIFVQLIEGGLGPFPDDMATLRKRKRKDGTAAYLAQIRIMREGVQVYQEASLSAGCTAPGLGRSGDPATPGNALCPL
ncbi:hypothetical protein [Pseudomonas solani]|uniref:hypothetical protein n=1 Tax=Pseudomonas solani TaxID=2731552 RepID=UPI00353163B1